MKGFAASVTAVALLCFAAAACTLLKEPAQCASDDDCAQFDAICGSQAICVPRNAADKGDASDNVSPTNNTGPSDTDASTTAPLDAKCAISPKPTANISMGLSPGSDGGSQVAATTLDCDKDWILDGPVNVPSGATLTIKAGTTIRAKKAVGAAIVIQPGGRIVAEGRKDAPIVMTVDDPATPKAGDWRGLFILGNAPRAGNTPYLNDALLNYGGNNANDESGVLKFVRVEYAQDGVFFGGVGKGTRVDSIQSRFSNDNCFVMNGGSFDAKHLVCQSPADEQFEIGDGYTGRLQFIYSQKTAIGDGHNGLLVDGPTTTPIIYNATICGQAQTQGIAGVGVVFRNGGKLDVSDAVIMGWGSAIDALGTINPATTTLRSSVAFGNAANPAALEADAANDDNAFDEVAFFRGADANNSEKDPVLADCHDAKSPKPWAAAPIAAGSRTPPTDGFFDVNAAFVGAFKDANDAWMTGWTRFDDK